MGNYGADLFGISGVYRLQGKGLLYHSSFDYLARWSSWIPTIFLCAGLIGINGRARFQGGGMFDYMLDKCINMIFICSFAFTWFTCFSAFLWFRVKNWRWVHSLHLSILAFSVLQGYTKEMFFFYRLFSLFLLKITRCFLWPSVDLIVRYNNWCWFSIIFFSGYCSSFGFHYLVLSPVI